MRVDTWLLVVGGGGGRLGAGGRTVALQAWNQSQLRSLEELILWCLAPYHGSKGDDHPYLPGIRLEKAQGVFGVAPARCQVLNPHQPPPSSTALCSLVVLLKHTATSFG